MAVIFISGQPGTGKTSLAKEICYGRDILLLSTDDIKSFCRLSGYGGLADYDSHSAWQNFGPKNKINIIKGFNGHARIFEKIILAMIKESSRAYKNIVIEGVHVTPRLYRRVKAKKIACYLDLPGRVRHWQMFDSKNRARGEYNIKWYENYDVIKIINNYAKERCQRAGFKIIKNRNWPKITQNIWRQLSL